MSGQQNTQVCAYHNRTVALERSLVVPVRQDNNKEPGLQSPSEDPEYLTAQAKRYKDALLLLVDTIRGNQPMDTFGLIEAIRNTESVREAAELLMQLSESAKASQEDSKKESEAETLG
ncbi:hypothetical protein BDV18DRAFT_163567 [Aspergillus unguis]